MCNTRWAKGRHVRSAARSLDYSTLALTSRVGEMMRDSDGGSGARAGNCGPGKGTKWRRGKMTWPAVMSIMLATSNHADAWQCALPGPGVLRPPGVGSLLPARMEAKSLWLMSHRHYPSPLLLRQKGSHYFASDGFFLARSNTRRAAGVIIRANEDTGEGKQDELTAFKQGDGSSRMLQSLPLPPLPYPFNSTLASLLSNTPSKWRAKVPKDWSLEADVLPPPSSTSTTSPSAQQWSSPSSKSSIGRSRLQHTISKNTKRIEVKSSEQLQTLLEQAVSVYKMDLRGISLPQRQDSKGRLLDPTQFQPTLEQLQHPVIAALQERRRAGSKPGKRDDGYKIALAIEGGGLRGCVSAGMASSLAHLGLEDSFDMVLGSSAGSIIGAYFVGRSTPQTTYRFFCNHLTTSKDHLNGANWLDISRLVDLFRPTASRTDNRAVMLLDYPMDDIMQRLCPLDWETFEKNDKVQPMQVIAAGLLTEGAVSLSSAEGSFRDLPSLCNCIKSSCMLPGIAGTQPKWHTASSAPQLRERFRGSSEDQGRRAEGKEPMVDALVYEPIPYRTALAQGATHVLVLRSYPDGTFLPKSLLGLFELVIAPKCLDPFPATKKHLATAGHSVIYAQDIMTLNEAQRRAQGGAVEDASLFAIAPLDVDGEVSQLTLDRQTLLRGIMQGFARCYDLFESPHTDSSSKSGGDMQGGEEEGGGGIGEGILSNVANFIFSVRDKLPLLGKASSAAPAVLTGDEKAIEVFLPMHYRFCQELAEKGWEKGLTSGTQTITVSSTYARQCQLEWNRARDKEAARQREADARQAPTEQGSASPTFSILESHLKIEKVGTAVPPTWKEGQDYVKDHTGFAKGELVVVRRSSGALCFGTIEVLVSSSTSLAYWPSSSAQCIVRVESPYGRKRKKESFSPDKLTYRLMSAAELGKIVHEAAEWGRGVATGTPGTQRLRKRDRIRTAWRRFRGKRV